MRRLTCPTITRAANDTNDTNELPGSQITQMTPIKAIARARQALIVTIASCGAALKRRSRSRGYGDRERELLTITPKTSRLAISVSTLRAPAARVSAAANLRYPRHLRLRPGRLLLHRLAALYPLVPPALQRLCSRHPSRRQIHHGSRCRRLVGARAVGDDGALLAGESFGFARDVGVVDVHRTRDASLRKLV